MSRFQTLEVKVYLNQPEILFQKSEKIMYKAYSSNLFIETEEHNTAILKYVGDWIDIVQAVRNVTTLKI